MISADQIRKVVENFLADNDANKFALQFASLSHNIHKNGDKQAIELVCRIQSKMADLHAKLISAAEFGVFLRSVQNPFVTNMPISVVISGPVNYPVEASFGYPALAGFFGTSRVAESESEHLLIPESH